MAHRRLLFIVCFLLLPSAAAAQLDPGRLVGVASDARGGRLPGVLVSAESPSLIGPQTAVTDAEGRFRLPALPPGSYVLTFSLTGFATVKRGNIVLATGQTLGVDVVLDVAGLVGDVFNAANSNAVTNFNLSNGANFGRINATLDPRTAMVGGRFSF